MNCCIIQYDSLSLRSLSEEVFAFKVDSGFTGHVHISVMPPAPGENRQEKGSTVFLIADQCTHLPAGNPLIETNLLCCSDICDTVQPHQTHVVGS